MLKIHFLNVGHGDCTIIEHPSGHLTMVDINNGDDLDENSKKEVISEYSFNGTLNMMKNAGYITEGDFLKRAGYSIELTDPLDYLLNTIKKNVIFRYIQTHPDIDHMCGLKPLEVKPIPIWNFWDTDNNKTLVSFKSDADEENWRAYQRYRKRTDITILNLYNGSKNKYFNQDDYGGTGDGIYILAPTIDLTEKANETDCHNLHSYVLWIEYGNRKIVLGGDADADSWDYIYKKHGSYLKCDILKAAHHGRDSGYYKDAVAAMHPIFTIVSVGKKPSTDASNKYRTYSDFVWSTRYKGNIVFEIYEDGSIIYYWQYE